MQIFVRMQQHPKLKLDSQELGADNITESFVFVFCKRHFSSNKTLQTLKQQTLEKTKHALHTKAISGGGVSSGNQCCQMVYFQTKNANFGGSSQ
jgi:FAD synthase